MLNLFKKRYEIVISAHDFGLGPTSIISQSLGDQKKYKFGLIGNKNQENFIKKQGFNARLIANQYGYLSEKSIKACVSCFDPLLVFKSWKNDIPVLYIDNLFWFWDFDKKRLKKIYEKILKLKNLSDSEFEKELNKIIDFNSHDPFVLGHFFSTESLIQRFGLEVEKRLKFIKKFNKKLNLFGALVPEKIDLKVEKSEKPLVYVQLGGMLNPNTGLKFSKDYVHYVANVFNKLNADQRFEILLKVNPIFEEIGNKYKNLNVISTLPFKEHLSYIKNCNHLILQPGQNGIYESVYFNKDIFLLPEQTTSHTIHVKEMMDHGFICDHHMFFDFYDPKSGKEDTKYLKRGLKEFMKSEEILFKKLDIFFKKSQKIKIKESKKRLDVTKKLLKNFSGNNDLKKVTNSFFERFV